MARSPDTSVEKVCEKLLGIIYGDLCKLRSRNGLVRYVESIRADVSIHGTFSFFWSEGLSSVEILPLTLSSVFFVLSFFPVDSGHQNDPDDLNAVTISKSNGDLPG